jgi:hypothetical protein
MEVGQVPNWGCSAKGKKYDHFSLLSCRLAEYENERLKA